MAREKIKKPPQLTDDQMERYRKEIESLAVQDISPEALRKQYREYLPDKPLGRAICMSYRREELTAVLSAYADKLGHAPAMHEVFPLYRSYIKRRFGTWPKALREAGLRYGLDGCRQDADWSRILSEEPEIGIALVKLSERKRTLGYPPTKKETQEGALLKQRFGGWNAVLWAADDLDAWLEENPTPLAPCEPIGLAPLTERAEYLGRTPLLTELAEEERIALRLKFGSWDQALRAAGLPALSPEETERAQWESRQRRQAGNCRLYVVKAPTGRQERLLEELEDLCGQCGRVPIKEEVPRPLWDQLIQEFSSWRNALFQLQKAPLSEQETRAIRRMGRQGQKDGLTKSADFANFKKN